MVKSKNHKDVELKNSKQESACIGEIAAIDTRLLLSGWLGNSTIFCLEKRSNEQYSEHNHFETFVIGLRECVVMHQ